MPAFEVQAFLRAIVDERINILTSVPAIYWLAMNQPDFADFDMCDVRLGHLRRRADRARRRRAGCARRSRTPGWATASA